MRLGDTKQKALRLTVERYLDDLGFIPNYEINSETLYNLASSVEIELNIQFKIAENLVIKELKDLDYLITGRFQKTK